MHKGTTLYAVDKMRSDGTREEYNGEKISKIQSNYFTDIKNQIFSQLEGEIDRETEKEIERWKKERRSFIKNRDKEMKKEKENRYIRIEN